jgi:hyperosmotically inducible periplasmic protein
MKKSVRYAGLIVSLMLTLALISCAGNRTSASTGEYVDDSVISTKVKTALHMDDDVSGFQVNVETFKGTVQLSGFVDTQEQADRAEEIARGVDGVEDVDNNITVK